VRTANTNRPSKAASRAATARHQRRGAEGRLDLIADVLAIALVLLMSSQYDGSRAVCYPILASKAGGAISCWRETGLWFGLCSMFRL